MTNATIDTHPIIDPKNGLPKKFPMPAPMKIDPTMSNAPPARICLSGPGGSNSNPMLLALLVRAIATRPIATSPILTTNLLSDIAACRSWNRELLMCLSWMNPGRLMAPKRPADDARQILIRSVMEWTVGPAATRIRCWIDQLYSY